MCLDFGECSCSMHKRKVHAIHLHKHKLTRVRNDINHFCDKVQKKESAGTISVVICTRVPLIFQSLFLEKEVDS